MAIEGAGTPIGRFDLRGGGSLTLYPGVLLERGAGHFDMLPLAAIVALRVSFERDRGRIGWGVTLIVLALLAFAISGPLGAFAGGAAGDMAGAAGSQGVARALLLLFRFLELGASLLPAASLAFAIGGGALVVHGWRGSTVLALTLAGTERAWASRGQDKLLLDFAELVGDRLMALER
jgi:hypothetical protein